MSGNTPQNAIASQAYRWTGAITLANGERHRIRAAGVTFVRCTELSGTGPKIVVDGGDVAPIFKALGIEFPEPVQKQIEIVNDTGASVTFELIYGSARVSDDRTSFGASGLDISKASTRTVTKVVCANAAATAILVADTTRREWVIANPSGGGTVQIRCTKGSTRRGCGQAGCFCERLGIQGLAVITRA